MPPIRIGGTTEEGVESFFEEYEKIQSYILERAEARAAAQPASADSIVLKTMAETNINLQSLINSLFPDEKETVMGRFRKLFQFEDMLGNRDELLSILSGSAPSENTGLLEVGEDLKTGRLLRFRVEGESITAPSQRNPLATILNNLNIQIDEVQAAKVLEKIQNGEDVADKEIHKAFKFGANILKSDYMRGVDQVASGAMAIPNGSNILVFDTETLGLSLGRGNIRQVSASTLMVGGQAGVDEIVDPFNKFFKTATAQVGMIKNPLLGQNNRLFEYFDDIARRTANADDLIDDVGSGEQFAKALKPLLRRMKDSDYIMGHNVQFDIDQILVGSRLTGAYLNATDQEFVDLVDQVAEKIGQQGSVIDTRVMARNKLPNLQTAPELAFAGKKTTHSLENIILQTNLIDLMVDEAGGGQAGRDEVMRMLGMTQSGAMHQADVDTLLTAKLFKFLNDDALVEQGLGIPGPNVSLTADEKTFYSRLRTYVKRSYAPTPISNIADIRNIDERMFETLLAEGDDSRIRFGVLDTQQGVMEQLERTSQQTRRGLIHTIRSKKGVEFSGTAGELQQFLSDDVEKFSVFPQLTPVEQEVFLTRRLVSPQSGVEVTDETFFNLGNFRRMTGRDTPYSGLLNKVGTFFKRNVSAGEFSGVQQALEKSGIPFAGLSMPEAVVTNVMSRATSVQAAAFGGADYATVTRLADDIGISHFGLWDDAMVTGGDKVQLPVEILRAAGIMDESGDMLSLSAFEYTDRATGELESGLSLTKSLADDEYEKLYSYIDSLDDDSIIEGTDRTFYEFFTKKGSGTTKAELLKGLSTSGKKFGVSIGGFRGETAEQINAVLKESALFEEILRDTSKIPFRVRLLDMVTPSGGERVARVGPFVLDRFMSDEDRVAYNISSERARGMLDDMVEYAGRPGKKGLLAAAEFASSSGRSDIAKAVFENYGKVKKASPIVLGVAAVGIGAALFAKNKKESEFYDETMEEQPTETSSDYIQYRRQMGMQPAPTRRLPDPLLTSYVVGNLDNNKIGHTQMGSQKYAHLYQ